RGFYFSFLLASRILTDDWILKYRLQWERKMTLDKKKQPTRNHSFEARGFRVVGVAGLGYVGLHVAIAFGQKFRVIGMDTNKNKINQLSKGIDPNGQLSTEQLENKKLEYVSKPYKLQECTHIIVAVPTPITDLDEPDLT